MTGYMDDLCWAAPFAKMVDAIKFVKARGPAEDSQPARRRTSQGALYSDFVKGELQRLLARGKARADTVFENEGHEDRDARKRPTSPTFECVL